MKMKHMNMKDNNLNYKTDNNNLYLTLVINTTKLEILKSKIYFLHKFCKIYSLNFNFKILPHTKKKITLLRSPHIHKKTWKTYLIRTIKFNFCILIPNNSERNFYISKLKHLLNVISTNCNINIKLNYIPTNKEDSLTVKF